MPSHTCTYFLGNDIVGVAQFDHYYNARSLAFFCPKCGDIWGRIHINDASWRVDNRFCVKHRNLPEATWDSYSGMFRSIWSAQGHDRSPEINLVPYLPHEVLIHDFLIASEKLNVTGERTTAVPAETPDHESVDYPRPCV